MSLDSPLVLMSPADGQPDSEENCTSSTGSPLISMLPREVRDILWKLALQYETIMNLEEGAWRCAPGLLKTSKQIYNEASKFYYTLNTFICQIGGPLWQKEVSCGLNFKMMKRIIIKLQITADLTSQREYEMACRKKLARLIHALLQVSEVQIFVDKCHDSIASFDTVEVLEPLALLRKVQRIEFTKTRKVFFTATDRAFFHEVGALVIGGFDVESCFLMYRNLKAYANSFERNYERKSVVDLEPLGLHGWPAWNDYCASFDLAAVSNLRRAGVVGAEEDELTFQLRRKHALLYLENQYLNIKIEKQKLFNPIHLQQLVSGTTRAQVLCNYYFKDNDLATSPMAGRKAFLALLPFSNSFIRRLQMSNYSSSVIWQIDPKYCVMDRDVAMMDLYDAAEDEAKLTMEQRLARIEADKSDKLYDWTICLRYFQSALHDMLVQHDEILRTRSLIFYNDIVADTSYDVEALEFEDSADSVYSHDDPDKSDGNLL